MEKYIREEAPHKHLIFVMNKCDLVPTGVAVSPNLLCCIPILDSFAFPLLSQDSFLHLMHLDNGRNACYNFGILIPTRRFWPFWP